MLFLYLYVDYGGWDH